MMRKRQRKKNLHKRGFFWHSSVSMRFVENMANSKHAIPIWGQQPLCQQIVEDVTA